jgi:actin-related protein
MSPEIFENKKYNSKSDIWSLGCILFEIMALKVPFNGNNMRQLSMNIISCNLQCPIPSLYSAPLRELVRDMLNKNPAVRPGINNVLQRPVVQGKIAQYLGASQRNIEFNHTVLHGLNILQQPQVALQHQHQPALAPIAENGRAAPPVVPRAGAAAVPAAGGAAGIARAGVPLAAYARPPPAVQPAAAQQGNVPVVRQGGIANPFAPAIAGAANPAAAAAAAADKIAREREREKEAAKERERLALRDREKAKEMAAEAERQRALAKLQAEAQERLRAKQRKEQLLEIERNRQLEQQRQQIAEYQKRLQIQIEKKKREEEAQKALREEAVRKLAKEREERAAQRVKEAEAAAAAAAAAQKRRQESLARNKAAAEKMAADREKSKAAALLAAQQKPPLYSPRSEADLVPQRARMAPAVPGARGVVAKPPVPIQQPQKRPASAGAGAAPQDAAGPVGPSWLANLQDQMSNLKQQVKQIQDQRSPANVPGLSPTPEGFAAAAPARQPSPPVGAGAADKKKDPPAESEIAWLKGLKNQMDEMNEKVQQLQERRTPSSKAHVAAEQVAAARPPSGGQRKLSKSPVLPPPSSDDATVASDAATPRVRAAAAPPVMKAKAAGVAVAGRRGAGDDARNIGADTKWLSNLENQMGDLRLKMKQIQDQRSPNVGGVVDEGFVVGKAAAAGGVVGGAAAGTIDWQQGLAIYSHPYKNSIC